MAKLFRNMSSGTQLLFLILFSILGYLFGTIISGLIVVLIDGNSALMDANLYSLTSLRLSQGVSTVCWLLLSSLAYLYLFQDNGRSFLKMKRINSSNILILSVLLVFTIQPLVGFLGAINNSFSFPESMVAFEQSLKNMEEMATSLINRMLSDRSMSGILINIFIIAVMAAVIEEIFFRGCLQQLIQKIVRNKHVAVWATAIIFSLVHMQFYGFLPRILLGAMLGYLFVWSSNLWIPIIAHFINNFTAVVLQILFYGTSKYDRMENFDLKNDLWLLPISLLLCGVIIYFIVRKTPSEDEISLEIE